MSGIKFQIIIPTVGGRETYLKWAIRSCLDQDYPDFEVLVSNNGGAHSVREVISGIGDIRIRYIETDCVIPMAVHWEFAVSNATGEVLTIIGDDDALMPGALKHLNDIFLKNEGIECVTHYPGQYFWPDYPEPFYQNRFSLRQGTGALETVEAKTILRCVMEFRERYGKLPFLYHGFVRRSLLDRIRRSQGNIFRRSLPDVYSDFALAASIGRYVRLDACLSLGGQGAKSNGAIFCSNREEGKKFLSDVPQHLIPKYPAANIHIQLFEIIEYIHECFPETRKNADMAWTRFAIRVLLEALATLAHFDDSARELRRIAAEKMAARERYFTSALLVLLRSPWIRERVSVMMWKRKKRILQHWGDAAALGIHDIYHLTQFIGDPSAGLHSSIEGDGGGLISANR